MKRLWRIGLVMIWLLTTFLPVERTAVHAATLQIEPNAEVEALLAQMSVAERVGQLFLVTFEGDAAPLESDIADLILNYRVGGVALLAEQNNITGYGNPTDVPIQVAELANDLQRLAISGETTAVSDAEVDLTEVIPVTPSPNALQTPIPLLISINQNGDGPPHSEIFNGLTQVPNNMAIGATWRPELAEAVGEVMGRELSAIGVNMLIGPALDVLENPTAVSPSDLGVLTFGGDPYWVGQMGHAYTMGLHEGSNNRLAVVAKHFPGNGGSDRPINEEVPTVRKSLEQLKQIELAPFFAITGGADSPTATVDALLTTHIRYQGFQGNIRATTAPVSFDPQALGALLTLPELGNWRNNGGVIVSDALGVRAVERFYDDTEQEFRPRLVAKDALLAGNDILYLADFALGTAPYDEQLANIKDTILWFQEKYETDVSFQQRVDDAVRNILQMKLKLYGGDFGLENVLVDTEAIGPVLATEQDRLFELAQTAVTLISPSQAEFAERLASPPSANETILIFTDVRETQQCDACPTQPYISQTALQEQMLALYGPNASNQLDASQIQSYSFAELDAFLAAESGTIEATIPVSPTLTPQPDAEPTATANPPLPTPTSVPTPTPNPAFLIQEQIETADWIIFATLDMPESENALTRFLAERPDIVSDSQVIVFAYNAPYFLDTTEISKLTAFFGVYSKLDSYIDASVRALFLELPPVGASPVDIEGVSYSLFEQTQPNSSQVIELYIADDSGETQSPPSESPLDASIGETLRLQTGIIRDHNGFPVPDGTIVQFIQRDRIQETVSIIAEQPTTNGIAQLDYVLAVSTGPGQFRITAVSGQATFSQVVDISIEGGGIVAAISTPTNAPTVFPTNTPTPSSTPTPTPTSTNTPVPPTPTPTPTPIPEPPSVNIFIADLQMLIAMMIGTAFIGSVGLWLSYWRQAGLAANIGWPLWGMIGGLLVYIYYSMGGAGTAVFNDLGSWAGLVTTFIGGLLGLITYQFYRPKA
ncbi:MAG: glycoside hydrolase family 3 N-terminal domain-containing protein [Chloroflexota bacterium]